MNESQISSELSRLITLQTEFYQKGNPTPDELQEFEQAGRRTRELFAQLAKKRRQREYQLPNRTRNQRQRRGTPCSNRAVATCADCGVGDLLGLPYVVLRGIVLPMVW